jgi:indolepyruvate ferredoxin oxidoreductase beta subunit
MEAARVLAKVASRTVVLVNTCPLLPASLQSRGLPYPSLEELLGPVDKLAGTVMRVDATGLAEKAGSHRALNVVMLGLLAGADLLPFAGSHLLDVVLTTGLPAFREVNRRAFEIGAEVGQRELATASGEAATT